MMLANIIEGVMDAGYEIAGVLRGEQAQMPWWKRWFYDFFKSSPVYTLIKECKIPEIKCKSVNSEAFRRKLLKLNADILLVATWHEKITKETFDIPKNASVNVHPSLLPKYRGPNPYLEAIRHGETCSGVTFHLIDENFDSGAILAQEKVDILPDYTGKELREKITYEARMHVGEVLKKLEYGLIKPVPQDEKKATYYPTINPIEMILKPEMKTAKEIAGQIRGFHPWYPCYIKSGGKYYTANPYRIEKSAENPIEIRCMARTMLKLDVKPYTKTGNLLRRTQS